MSKTLGISIGTRLMGMAVLHDGELAHFRIRTFAGKWDTEKCARMVHTVEKQTLRYRVTEIIVKAPIAAHCTKNIWQLIDSVRDLSAQYGIPFSVCTIRDLKQERDLDNRQGLINALLQSHKNNALLYRLAERERRNNQVYHTKLFEAIACAELGQKTRR